MKTELFQNIRVSVALDGGVKEQLLAKADGAYEGPGVTLCLQTKWERGVCVVFVKAALTEGCFDPEGGVFLTFDTLGPIRGYLADYRHSEYWCRPYFGMECGSMPPETQALLWEKKSGGFGFFLPVCGAQQKATLEGRGDGFAVRLASWCGGLKECSGLAFLYAEGDNPYQLARDCVKTGLSLLPGGYSPREERRYPELFEYLGWCSWDALQIRVCEEGMRRKCEEFREKEIPVRYVILDDMWGDVRGLYDVEHPGYEEVLASRHGTSLYSFDADPVRFPEGLSHCVQGLKKDFGVKVGIWHPASGYWSGIDPDGPIARDYADCLMRAANGTLVPDFHREKAFRYFDAYHAHLKECGADFLKIDNQSTLRRFYGGFAPVGEIARDFHIAMEASAGLHFDQNLINCMGMASENMWNRPVSALSRVSDDFLPENREWFRKHILQCAYNSLLQGNFLWCDWDMWWTADGQGVKNSVLRAISGGPIYISDRIGESRKETLLPLVFSDGRILRCDRPAVPAPDCLVTDPVTSKAPFKLQSLCGEAGVVAAFNLREEGPAEGFVGIDDVDGLPAAAEYVIYEHFSGNWAILRPEERFPVTLGDGDAFGLYLLLPLKDGFAPIGLREKLLSPRTIVSAKKETLLLREGGEFLFVSLQKPASVFVNGRETEYKRTRDLYSVNCRDEGEVLVSIRLEG